MNQKFTDFLFFLLFCVCYEVNVLSKDDKLPAVR